MRLGGGQRSGCIYVFIGFRVEGLGLWGKDIPTMISIFTARLLLKHSQSLSVRKDIPTISLLGVRREQGNM